MLNKNILVLCGGGSAEHKISLLSTINIVPALKKLGFKTILVGIDTLNKWIYLENLEKIQYISCIDELQEKNISFLFPKEGKTYLAHANEAIRIDIIFPILHGKGGEDGTIQAFCEFWNVPFIGSSVGASAIGMNKYLFKLLLKSCNLPIVPFLLMDENLDYISCKKILDSEVLFIKPNNMGSSIGVSKVRNATEFNNAIQVAKQFSDNIIIEKYIRGRELECSVLGNNHLNVSQVGELKIKHDFYSYEAKYLDSEGAVTIIPANLPHTLFELIKLLSAKVFKLIEAKGIARVDFFLSELGEIYINEVNTMPGFTNISMCPKLWEESGISYEKLLLTLINLALEDHARKQILLRNQQFFCLQLKSNNS